MSPTSQETPSARSPRRDFDAADAASARSRTVLFNVAVVGDGPLGIRWPVALALYQLEWTTIQRGGGNDQNNCGSSDAQRNPAAAAVS